MLSPTKNLSPIQPPLLFPSAGLSQRLSVNSRRKWITVLQLMGYGLLLGIIYPVFGDGFGSIVPFINGMTIGFLGGGIIGLFELYVFYPIRKRLNFLTLLFSKIIVYFLALSSLIIVVILISRSIQYHNSLVATYHSEEFQHFLYNEDLPVIVTYALTLVSLIIFTRQMHSKLGPGVLLNFITGKYHKPRTEERIFMFLDLNSSTTIAEKLGDLKFHYFLNDFFYDITECILSTKGEIYQYVGDEVVVTWNIKKGLKNGNCIQAFYLATHHIHSLEEKYLKKFGIVPHFKAAYHCGKVIIGEVGDVKSEIVFHGDVVNTTSRIEYQCHSLGKSVLISEKLLHMLPKNIVNAAVWVDNIQLKGKEKKLGLYTLPV